MTTVEKGRPKKKARPRTGPIGGLVQAPYVNAPDELLTSICERIDKRIFSDRTLEQNCVLLSAAYKEIKRQRRVIKRIDRKLTTALQHDLLTEDS